MVPDVGQLVRQGAGVAGVDDLCLYEVTAKGFRSGFPRPRALNLTELAGARTIAGDSDTAVSVGHHAIDAVTAVSFPRPYDRLRVLNTALQPLHTSAGVAELRERPTTTVT